MNRALFSLDGGSHEIPLIYSPFEYNLIFNQTFNKKNLRAAFLFIVSRNSDDDETNLCRVSKVSRWLVLHFIKKYFGLG